jgi:hypothetical protein
VFVRLVDTLPPATVGIAYEPTEAAIYALAGSGDLYRKPLAPESPARVRLVDALGRTVATLHDGLLPAGTACLGVEAEGLAAGTYLAVVEAGGARVVRPLTAAR